MKEIIEVECKVVKERTLEIIAAEIRTIDAQMCQTVLQGAIEIGRRLQEAKEQTGHGNWRNWCKENLNYSEDWAENMMRIAEEYGTNGSAHFAAISNTDTCRNLSISKALKLLKVPEDDIEDFVKENNPGDLTVKELEEKIKELQEEKEDLGNELMAVEGDYDRIEEEKEILEKQIRELREQIEAVESDKEGDDEEIKAAHEALEQARKEKAKAEEKAEGLKKKMDKLNADMEAEKEKAREAAKKEAEEEATKKLQAEMEESKKTAKIAEVAKEEAEARAQEAIAKLDRASNPDVAVFAVKRQILIETFEDMLAVIDRTEEEEQKEKFRIATAGVLEQLRAEVEGETK